MEGKASIIKQDIYTYKRDLQEELMNRTMKKLLCFTTAGVLGLSALAGCGSKKIDGTKPLLTGKEDTVTVGTGNLVLRMNQVQMMSYMSMMGGGTAGMWEQKTEDGKTYGEQTKDSVLEQLKDMMLLKEHGADYDVSVSDDEKKNIEEAAKKFMDANTKETIEKLSVQQSDVEELLTLFTYQNKMYEPMTTDVDTNVEDSEAAQSAITYCKVSTADKTNEDGTTTPLTDEEKNEKKAQAQSLLDKLLSSDDPAMTDMDTLAKEVDENLSALDTTFGAEDTLLDAKLLEAAKTLQDGQIYESVVEGENAYYVVRMDQVLDREATDTAKERIVNERKQEAYQKLLDEWKEKAEITVNKKEWKKVTLSDSDVYTLKQPEMEETSQDNTEDTQE